jgi:hypothetical protein
VIIDIAEYRRLTGGKELRRTRHGVSEARCRTRPPGAERQHRLDALVEMHERERHAEPGEQVRLLLLGPHPAVGEVTQPAVRRAAKLVDGVRQLSADPTVRVVHADEPMDGHGSRMPYRRISQATRSAITELRRLPFAAHSFHAAHSRPISQLAISNNGSTSSGVR